MRTIDKFRLLSHDFGATLASIGLYLLFLSLIVEPTLLSYPTIKTLYILYLTLYPILIAFVIVENISLLKPNVIRRIREMFG